MKNLLITILEDGDTEESKTIKPLSKMMANIDHAIITNGNRHIVVKDRDGPGKKEIENINKCISNYIKKYGVSKDDIEILEIF